MQMKEVWKTAVEGYYEVSNYGRVRSLDRVVKHPQGPMQLKGRELRLNLANTGYLQVEFRINAIRETWRVHTLVALLFVYNPDPDKFTQVNHINGNKLDNKEYNLEWCTGTENITHAFNLKLIPIKKGIQVHNAVLDEIKVKEIRKLYATGKYFQSDLDKMFEVGAGTVNKIVRNLTWTHIK